MKPDKVLVIVLAIVAGCSAKKSGVATYMPPADLEGPPATYVLGPGDHIDVKFPYKTEFNETLVIRPDGFISLQLVGDIRAAGSPPADLAARINQAYAGWIRNPHATVIVREFASQRVYVGGEVRDPGPVVLQAPLTCLQAVVSRGGVKTTANIEQVLLIRRNAAAAAVYELDLKSVMKGEAADVPLRPYDVVYVPMSAIAEIGEFVEQYINKLVPRSLSFPYDLNTRVDVRNDEDPRITG